MQHKDRERQSALPYLMHCFFLCSSAAFDIAPDNADNQANRDYDPHNNSAAA